jgi:hypothetical protein
MAEATRPSARGSEPMSRWCHERAYARRVYATVLALEVERVEHDTRETVAAIIEILGCGGPMEYTPFQSLATCRAAKSMP